MVVSAAVSQQVQLTLTVAHAEKHTSCMVTSQCNHHQKSSVKQPLLVALQCHNFDMYLTPLLPLLMIQKHTKALTYTEAASGRTGMQRSMTHAGQLAKP